MPGFRITNIRNKAVLDDQNSDRLISESFSENDYYINRNTIKKFLNDKVFINNDHYIIVIEGVVLNKNKLIQEYKRKNWIETISYMLQNDGIEWFKKMEGPLSGAVYYKNEDIWCFFTGRLGEKAVYYWCDDKGNFVVGSQLYYITDLIRQTSRKLIIDEEAMIHMMVYGSYIGTETGIKDIKRLYPGNYLIIRGLDLFINEYYIADVRQVSDVNEKSDDEIIDELDNAFLSAIKKIVKKNEEYGYLTVADISSGCDSRLNVFALDKIGVDKRNTILDCYAQTYSDDAIISMKIAKELEFDYVFRSLDSAGCMFDIDSNVKMLNGATHYYGITGGKDMLKMLGGLNIGLEITGLLGDIHDGSMVTGYSDGRINPNIYRYSNRYVEGKDFVFPQIENDRFQYHVNEHFWFYNRGMICGMSSFFIRQNFTEAVTPYGDTSFMELYLSIPWERRVKERLLRKWLVNKYPMAGEFHTTHGRFALKYDVGRAHIFFDFINRCCNKIEREYGKILQNKKPKGMNDIHYWYNNNVALKKYIDTYIDGGYELINHYPRIKSALAILEKGNTAQDRLMIANVMSIIKVFCA